LAIAMYLGAALAGAAIALAADRAMVRDTRGADPRSSRTRFFDQLSLTPAQRDSATRLFDARDRRFRALMDDKKAVLEPVRAAQDSIDAEWRQNLMQLLTPEQKATYEKMRAARNSGGRGGDTRR
jgi:Spy/CpxP family protein refolding chaperone